MTPKYVTAYDAYGMSTYYQQGYKLVKVLEFTESHPVNYTGNWDFKSFAYQLPSTTTRYEYLMELSPTAETLFGDKKNDSTTGS